MEEKKQQVELKSVDEDGEPQSPQSTGTAAAAANVAAAAAAATAAAAGAGGDTERDASASASTAMHPVVKQKCLFTTNHTTTQSAQPAPPVKTTNFNVTASPFVSTQHLRLPAAIVPKENGGAIGGCVGLCTSVSSPHLAARMCTPLQHIPSMPHTGPKGVDTRIWRSISARHVNTVYSYDDEMNRAVRRCFYFFYHFKFNFRFMFSTQQILNIQFHFRLVETRVTWTRPDLAVQSPCPTEPFRSGCAREFGILTTAFLAH